MILSAARASIASFLLPSRGLLAHARHLDVLQLAKEAGALAGVADIAVSETRDTKQHGVFIAVLEDTPHLQSIARGLTLGPEFPACAAEERGESGSVRHGKRLLVHESDHEHFAAA